jgi:hypothetical protein
LSKPANIVPFGKYKDKPVEALVADREYCQWLMAQPWFRDRFQPIYQVVINYGAEPECTPEHNALQAKFLDEKMCAAVALLLVKTADFKVDTTGSGYYDDIFTAEILKGQPVIKIKNVQFECDGWDVRFAAWMECEAQARGKDGIGRCDREMAVEIKPSIGDEFPAIMRQIKARRQWGERKVLVTEEVIASSVSEEDVGRMLASIGVNLLLMSEIRDLAATLSHGV